MLRDKTGETLSLNINEIYKSIQGEGLLVGSPCVFIRIQGCNLRCPWCDQPSSLSFVERYMKIEDILKEIDKFCCRHVVITGGEPFTEPNLPALTKEIIERGYFVQIETNGTLWNPQMGPIAEQIYISCSPKREASFFVDEHILLYAKEIKFVVDDEFEEDIVLDIRFRNFLEKKLVVLQPESNRQDMFEKCLEIQERILKLGFTVRVIPQIHKIFGIP